MRASNKEAQNKVALKFLQAKHSYKEHSFVQKQMAQRLFTLLQKANLQGFTSIFEFGCGTGNLSEILVRNLDFERLILSDINDYGLDFSDKRVEFRAFDMRELALQRLGNFELVASNATLQWLDFKQSLSDINEILADNGFLLFSSFSKGNFKELKEATKLSLAYLSEAQMRAELLRYFKIISFEKEQIRLKFDTTLELFRYLKRSGVNSLGYTFLGKEFLQNYEKNYQNSLTYEIVYFLCQKHPKP